MVKLLEQEIHSKEILDWTGLHLFHAGLSSCSQKTRIFLIEKGIPWQSHPIDLMANENISEFYLGINPRGLVPALVDDGSVHIESNDIILYLEEKFPNPRLLPSHDDAAFRNLLAEEDRLHKDVRNITFRFIVEPPVSPKSSDDLDRYSHFGSATVGGERDDHKAKEIAYWRNYSVHRVSNDDVRHSIGAFHKLFSSLDGRLQDAPFLLGSELSIADIAWFVYANRLQLAGYPLGEAHPHVWGWFERLMQRPGWAEDVAAPPPFLDMVRQHQRQLESDGRRLIDVYDFAEAAGVS